MELQWVKLTHKLKKITEPTRPRTVSCVNEGGGRTVLYKSMMQDESGLVRGREKALEVVCNSQSQFPAITGGSGDMMSKLKAST